MRLCKWNNCGVPLPPRRHYCDAHVGEARDAAYERKKADNIARYQRYRKDPERVAELRRKIREYKKRVRGRDVLYDEEPVPDTHVTFRDLESAHGDKFIRLIHNITQEGYSYNGTKGLLRQTDGV